jgi:hypothetical protein
VTSGAYHPGGIFPRVQRRRTAIGEVHRSLRLGVVLSAKNPPTGIDRQHESQEARSLYPSALQLTRDLMLRFIGRAT